MYLSFIAANRRFVGFGFAMALASSFGQTFFIGVFGPQLQAEFGLTHTEWGTLYMAGTLASAAVLPWSGRLIDRVDLRYYAIGVALLLALACGFTGGAVVGSATLVVAIFLLRHAGQGLASHVAVTTMARYFDERRGLAIAVAGLGFAAGEALLPVTAVQLIDRVGWRWSYVGIAVAIVGGLCPLVAFCLRGHRDRHRAYLEAPKVLEASNAPIARSWTRAEVLRDVRFYLLLPGLVAPAVILTALFFHHLIIAEAKGWTHSWITGNYVSFALTTVVVALACGPLIDRLGGTRLVSFMLVPLAACMVVLATIDHPASVWVYFGLMGLSIGVVRTAPAAMWAELYGVEHIGAIRSLVTALAVLASALGPVTMGGLIDAGMSIDRVLWIFVAYVLASTILLVIALRGGASTRR